MAYLDFGKMDRLEDDDRFALMSVVVHFANRDAGGEYARALVFWCVAKKL